MNLSLFNFFLLEQHVFPLLRKEMNGAVTCIAKPGVKRGQGFKLVCLPDYTRRG